MVLVHKVYTVNKQAKKESSTINRVLQIRVYPNRQQSQILNDAVWEERKFARAVVWLGMLLRGTVGVAPVTITDESIDEALTTKEEERGVAERLDNFAKEKESQNSDDYQKLDFLTREAKDILGYWV
ncbi:hypothetical protein GLOIN_2v1486406 [Rhizophagus irregularis DAOM 181602=DAOM 197198]|uniref:Uncharacterized protein n=1 Tax=Rhizophagus irregularis (strain DAOM 181602 / DAOM 197198 / MUCL 43194) TaxID=747089 RepID=U9SK50_RHIID|nr:hypothetical protein GLOIN_2v1486406 [Rhizophagus irregularis DAOM 181602=DAOM 197198]